MSFLAPPKEFKPKKKNALGRGRTGGRRDGEMNKLERDYAFVLEAKQNRGEIDRWDYEPEKLRLADRTFYSPDFRVVMLDGTIEFHETKGFWEEDARVKIKVAAEQHPYKFIAIMRKKGEWVREEF